MNVEIGAEAALFPEKEYTSGIAVAVYYLLHSVWLYSMCLLPHCTPPPVPLTLPEFIYTHVFILGQCENIRYAGS